MALCEGQLDSVLPKIKTEEVDLGTDTIGASPEKLEPVMMTHPGVFAPGIAPGITPPIGLAVDYRSPRAHFLPPEIEMYNQGASTPLPTHSPHAASSPARSTTSPNTLDSSSTISSSAPMKRKRGRPRVDKTSPEYLAKSAARHQAKIAAALNSSGEMLEKRKRGRPRVDKTSPEYIARKRARELEALEKKAKRQIKRRSTAAYSKMPSKITRVTKVTRVAKVVKGSPNGRNLVGRERKLVIRRKTKFVKRVRIKDSGASSSTGDTTPHAKRKYTRRPPSVGAPGVPGQAGPKKRGRKKKIILGPDGQPMQQPEKPRGKRGRRRKSELIAAGLLPPAPPAVPKKRGRPKIDRSTEMRHSHIVNSEPIPVDSDDEPEIGSPDPTSDLNLDENYRALQSLHEKYANIAQEQSLEAHLLAANFRQEVSGVARSTEPVTSSPVRKLHTPSSEPKVEKLEDSTDSDSSSSGSGSSSSGSGSSSSSSGSSSSDSDSSDSEPGTRDRNGERQTDVIKREDDRSFGAWSHNTRGSSDSASEGEVREVRDAVGSDEPHHSLSESENESPDKSFQCNVCHKWYSTNVTLKIHKRSHLNRSSGNSRWRRRVTDRYECDCCQETFSCRENLLEHKAEAHRGAMTVRCEVCRRCFEDDNELTAHLRSHTADERASRCSECGSQFSRWEQLRRHRACVHPPPTPVPRRHPHACHQCGKAFGHAHSLTRHLANHSKAIYRCVVCKSSFDHADTLAQHLNSHLANYKRLKP